MNVELVVRFIYGMVIGGLPVLLIWKSCEIKRLKHQKKIMYDVLESISDAVHFDYDPDASIPDDYDDLKTFCFAARCTNRRLRSDANMALNEIDRMDGRDV